MPAKRGLILDRTGQKILADNQPAYSLTLDRIVMRPIVKGDKTHRDKLIAFLGQVLGTTPQDIEARFDKGKVIPVARPIPIGEDLSLSQVASIQAQSLSFPELNVEPVQRRNYPYGTMAAHMVGFIGEVNDKDLGVHKDLKQGDLIGKRGVELMYDEYLRGKDGTQYWEYDSHGRRLAEVKSARQEPLAGNNVYLTIDFDLQRRAEQYFIENEFVGAVVALDPRNGEVLAMVSRPAYDPNKFAVRIQTADWKNLTANPDNPLLNRAIQAQLAPGSTFKPLMALAGLETGAINDSITFFCSAGASFFGHFHKCHKRHGSISLHHAIEDSCDAYFYNVGNRMGIDNIAFYAEKAGFGHKTGIDLPNEADGIVPSTQWKIRNYRQKWYAGDTISVAIGQGALTITPLQLAHAIGGIAMGGVWYKPHLVKGKDEKPRQFALNQDNVQKVIDGMYAVVNGYGTGGRARLPGIEVCGKTGTAQLASNAFLAGHRSAAMKDNAWFVGFAQKNNPEIVVAALFENGEHGHFAAPIVKDVIKAYYDKKARLGIPNSPGAPRTRSAEAVPAAPAPKVTTD
jgi:penicillin-binding protein 2